MALRERLRADGLIEFRKDGVYLTPHGEQVLLKVYGALRDSTEAGERPKWDATLRRLSWREQVVKRLRREATCQVAVLEAFEAAGWPERIDDPLPDEPGLDRKERLRETVKSLMRTLTPGTICFHADGTGTGIRWEAVS